MLSGDVRVDGGCEAVEVLAADDPAELSLGFEHARRGPAQAHLAALPVLDVAASAPDDLDHRLDWVRARQGPPELPVDPEALQGEGLFEAFAERNGEAGVAALELAGEHLELVKRRGVIGELPGRPKPTLDRGAVALGEVVENVALLVADAALDRHGPEHLVDRGPQPLATVERVLHNYEQRYTLGNDSVPDTESRHSRTQLVEAVAAAVASSGLPAAHTETDSDDLALLPRLDCCLAGLAGAQAYSPRPLLSASGAGDRRPAGQPEWVVTRNA